MIQDDERDGCNSLFSERLRQTLAKAGGGLLLLCCAVMLMAAAPPAGSRLQNRASFSYINSATGLHETLQSNIVSVIVLPQEALVLTTDQTVKRAPNSVVHIPHTLINTGNTSFTAAIHFNNQGGDDYDLTNLTMAIDLNNNGIADSGGADCQRWRYRLPRPRRHHAPRDRWDCARVCYRR